MIKRTRKTLQKEFFTSILDSVPNNESQRHLASKKQIKRLEKFEYIHADCINLDFK